MKVKLFLILFLSLALLGAVTAIDTEVTIKTLPNHDLQIAFLVPDTAYGLLGDGLVHKSSDSNGKSTLIQSISRDDFEVKIWLKKDGETILTKRYEEVYDAGIPLELELYPKWYTPPEPEIPEPKINETVNETTEESNETELPEPILEEQETQTPIEQVKAEKERVTAFSVENGKVSISTKGFLYIFGLIILGVLIFLGIKHSHHVEKVVKSVSSKKGKKSKGEIKVKKMSEVNKKKSHKLKEQEEKIEKAKRMIEDAQREINKMKNPNQSKIDEIKKRLIEDEKELMRLRRESGDIN